MKKNVILAVEKRLGFEGGKNVWDNIKGHKVKRFLCQDRRDFIMIIG